MKDKIKILLVEDDTDLGRMLKLFLEMEEFIVTLAGSAEEGLDLFSENSYSIGIIDVNLPGINGFDFADKIHKQNSTFPFIFLTARTIKEDRIIGLKLGADDYITKPFDAEELILRLRNILKRAQGWQDEILDVGGFSIDMHELHLIHPSRVQKLTRREAELLHYLMQNQNKLVRTKDILTDLWGEDDYFLGRSMNVFISRLRKYLALDSSISIRNVRAEGYELVVIH